MAGVKIYKWMEGDREREVTVDVGQVFSTAANAFCRSYEAGDGGKRFFCPVTASVMSMDKLGSIVGVTAGTVARRAGPMRFETLSEGVAVFLDVEGDSAFALVYNEGLEV